MSNGFERAIVRVSSWTVWAVIKNEDILENYLTVQTTNSTLSMIIILELQKAYFFVVSFIFAYTKVLLVYI